MSRALGLRFFGFRALGARASGFGFLEFARVVELERLVLGILAWQL